MSKSKRYLVCEAHELIESHHFLPLSELRVLQLCLARLYWKGGIEKDAWYEVDKKAYAQVFNISEQAAYEALLGAVISLKNRSIVLKSTLLDPNVSEKSKTVIGWIDSCRYNNETLKLELKWTPDLINILNKLGTEYPYSKYYLHHVCMLSSLHSMRLYRLLNRFLFCRVATFGLEEFKLLMGIGTDEKDTAYQEFKYLNQFVLKPALKDINENTNLVVEMLPMKLGRRVNKLRFKMYRKAGTLPEELPEDLPVLE